MPSKASHVTSCAGKNTFLLSLFIISIFVFFIIVLPYALKHWGIGFDDNIDFEAVYFYYLFALIINSMLVLIAYFKIKDLLKSESVRNILLIDERWHSPQLFKAREIILKLALDYSDHGNYYSEAAAEPEKAQKYENINKQIKLDIANKIVEMSRKGNQLIEEFALLKEMLGFLETMGWLVQTKSITLEDIHAVFGHSIKFYYEIFALIIERERDIYNDNKLYENFEKLYERLR